MVRALLVGILILAVILVAVTRQDQPQPAAAGESGRGAGVGMALAELGPAHPCTGTFVSHNLDFSTGTRLREIATYLSNGAGVAANDLDGDGDLDLVFASVDRESAILWNRGHLAFEAEALDDRFTRGVAVVDVDGDGRLDIVFTHRGLDGVSYWRNLGDATGGTRFQRQPLPGVDGYAYAMAWGDVDGDGVLDLVTGSYAAELLQHGIEDPAQDPRAGVILYRQQDGRFIPQVLDPVAETLAIGILDLDGDGRPEIWVANDFALRDQVWRFDGAGWAHTEPFPQTSHSTMSLDWGDITGSGGLALFSTDMNPYDTSPANLAKWLSVFDEMDQHHERGDPQIMANVLLLPSRWGGWNNQATRRGVDASGWSWAGRLGDLDGDGALDLYVVNGMIASDLFGYLPNGELVEENLAFRNRGDGVFEPAPAWNLGSTASGRGMIMADLDDDGDLDIVVNNLRSRAQLFENRLCGGANLQVELRWPGARNRHAIGAQVRLLTDTGIQWRDVRASGGYLSGDPTRIHFGFPTDTHLTALEIVWPDGALSRVDTPPSQARITLTRQETTP